MVKSSLVWLIILAFIGTIICFFLPMEANAANFSNEKLSLVSVFRNHSQKELVENLLHINKIQDSTLKLKIYKSIFQFLKDNKSYSEQNKYILSKLIAKLEFENQLLIPQQFKIVFTGSLGVGKSTIIDMLEKEGYSVIHEVATDIIQSELLKDEDLRIVPWKGDEKRLQFQLNVANTQKILEQRNLFYLQFLDRSMADGLVYLKNAGKKEETLSQFRFISEYLQMYRYNLIFYFELLPKLINTDFRKEDDDFRNKIAPAFIEIYENLGYKIIHVPFMSPKERLEFIKMFVPEKYLNISLKILKKMTCMPRKTLKIDDTFLQAFYSFENFQYFYKYNIFTMYINGWDFLKFRLLTDNLQYGYKYKLLNEGTFSNTMNHTFFTIKAVDSLTISDEDKKLLRLIMFFHDFGKWVSKEGHEANSAIITKKILENLNFESKQIDFICKIIKYHGELGRFPNSRLNLKLLTHKELDFLYWTTLCDISERFPFDNPSNIQKIDMIYRHLRGDKVEEHQLEIKLNLIDRTVRIFDFIYEKNIDLLFMFKNLLMEYNLKSINKIAHAA